MSKRFTNLLVCLALGAVLIVTGLLKLTRDINIDLNKSNVIYGEVIDAGITTLKTSGIKYNSYFRVYYFRLNNLDGNFAIHREYEGYDDLASHIQIGDSIKVFYRSGSQEYNRNVYQVEKKGVVIEAYKNYNNKTSTRAAMAFMLGIIIVSISLIHYFNFNVWKFLDSLVK